MHTYSGIDGMVEAWRKVDILVGRAGQIEVVGCSSLLPSCSSRGLCILSKSTKTRKPTKTNWHSRRFWPAGASSSTHNTQRKQRTKDET